MRRVGLLIVTVVLGLSACEQTFRDMYNQPRYKPLASSELWPDGRASRPPVEGTVPYSEGTLAGTASGRLGLVQADRQSGSVDTIRDDLRTRAAGATDALRLPTITRKLLDRGRDRFDIFCSPCHSIAGDGDGMVARRGFPHPPSFHSDALRQTSDAHIYAVITHGYGAMYPYASAVQPQDRLAVIAYIRALQLSQHAPIARLDEEDRARLSADAGSAQPPGHK